MNRTNSHRIWLKTVIIPSLLILCLFVAAGWWAICSLRTFYYEERFTEAALTGELYSMAFALAIDAQQRFDDNSLKEASTLAGLTHQIHGSLTPQQIMDELSRHNRHIRLALIDENFRVLAATDPTKVHSVVERLEETIPVDAHAYTVMRYEGTSFLAYHLPLSNGGDLPSSLVVLFDLTDIHRLLHWVAIIVTMSLLLFYLLLIRAFATSRHLNRQIMQLATHDELTGLGNLRLFKQAIEALGENECALLMINSMNFKRLNMLYGYTHGDEVLVKLADYLDGLSRENPGWSAFRLSDDRFLLLITSGFDHHQLTELATTIINEGHALTPMAHPALSIGLTVRRGSSPYRAPLLKQALIALNSTRADNPIQFYNTDLEARLVRDNTIEQLLKRAIAGEEGLLSLSFQPIFSCSSGHITAFEALARLKDEELGSISPEEFIPIAERQQLITPLGMLLFPMALALIEGLSSRGVEGVRVAINVSVLQLLDGHFIDFIRKALVEHGTNASLIELELTESAFADEEIGLNDRLLELRSLGIRLSIDDFGCGYSSLSRLRSMQFDTLKLGQPFLQHIEREQHAYLLGNIISMAHYIGKQVVAEGVETAEQRDALIAINCDLLQGYLLGRPLSLEEALDRAVQEGSHD